MKTIMSGIYLITISILFSGCFGFPSRKGFPTGGGSEEDINMIEYVSDVMLWAAIAALIGGGVIIAIFKKPMLGFQTLGLGALFLLFGYVLRFIGDHIEIFIALFVFAIGATAYLIYKAVIIGVPWFERWTNIDWNHDGVKGTAQHVKPVPDCPVDHGALEPVASNNLEKP